MKTLTLIFILFISSVVSQKFLQEGGLHDYIFRLPRETLIKWAFATEKFDRVANQQQHVLGGLEDYINNLSNQEIIQFILKKTDQYPEIANKERLDSLSLEFGFDKKTVGNPTTGGDGGLHDYIWKLPREKIITWALTAEAYHRDVNHLHLVGGLDDYITNLSNQQIIEYIMGQVKEHPELSTQGKFDSLSQKYNIDVNSAHNIVKTSSPIGGDGGLHDFIWRMERPQLNNWALASERYHRDVNNIHTLGGLHDYIDNLSNQQIIEYIMKEVKEHPEIASSQKLDALVSKFGISNSSPQNAKLGDAFIGGDGGLHDYIWKMERPSLNKWALTTERYHRKVNNLHIYGGLHEYINSLSNQEVIEYIMREVKEHPEIASSTKLDSLSAEYGLTGAVESHNFGGDGGLHDYIFRLPRNTLESWALASEKYHNQGQLIMGGLHDYINNLSNQQLIEHIMKEVKEHPEIASGAKLDSLVAQYGISGNSTTPIVSNENEAIRGGIHDIVRSLDRKSLISWALAMDKYNHEKQPGRGGIDDYVNKLEDNEIRNFIFKQVQSYPELNSRMAIEGLIKKFNISVNAL